MAGISLIFHTEQAARIPGFFRLASLCDFSGIFFRFGEIDRNVDAAIFCLSHPFFILCNSILSDVVGCLAEFIIKIRREFGIHTVKISKLSADHGGRRGKFSHNFRVIQISHSHCILLKDALFPGIVQQIFQYFHQLTFFMHFCWFIVDHIEQFQKLVGDIYLILIRNESRPVAIGYQFSN